MPKKTMEQYKEEAKKNLLDIYRRLAKNEFQFDGRIRTYDQALEALEDKGRFERYVKYKEVLDERREQIRIKNELVKSNPEKYGALCNGPFERCFEMLLNVEDSKAARDYNKEIADKYCTVEGRADLVLNAISNLMQIKPKEIYEVAGDPFKMADMVVEDPLLFEQAYLIDKIRICPELDFNKETKDFLNTQKTFFEGLNVYNQCKTILGSELNFLMKDEADFPDVTLAQDINQGLAYLKDDELRGPAESLVTMKYVLQFPMDFKAKMEEMKGINFDQPMYFLKAVDKDGKEVSLDSIDKKDVTVVERSLNEINDLRPDGIEDVLAGVETASTALRDISYSHNCKKKPGFFSRFFNTRYNREYNAEIADIAALQQELKDVYKISDEGIKMLTEAKDDSERYVEYVVEEKRNALLKDDFGYYQEEKKVPIEINDAAMSEKQQVMEEKLEENEMGLDISNEIEKSDENIME